MACVESLIHEAGIFEPNDSIFANYQCDVIKEINITTKIISLQQSVTSYNPVDDIYREVRSIRRFDESVRVVDTPVLAQGNEPTTDTGATPRRIVVRDPWKIAPFPTNTILQVTGEQISDVGTSGSAVLDFSGHDTSVPLATEYAPPNAEIIYVNATGQGLTAEQATWLEEIRDRLDLNTQKPITYAKDLSTVSNSDWTLTKSDNNNGTVTVQRS